MLRNRSSRAVTKQPIMADQSSLPSPTQNPTLPVSSFFGSPRFFNGFLAKGLISDGEAVMSPTSILDTIHFSNFVNPFGFDKTLVPKPPKNIIFSETKHPPSGLALIDFEEKPRKVLFGSKLKIQIPPLLPISPIESLKSPGDFGTKTRNLPFSGTPTAFGSCNPCIQTRECYSPPGASTGPLSLSEMELSEEYTCVISHGPNPRLTHIYDNCVVGSCCGVVGSPELKMEHNLNSPSQNFLSFCYNCKKNLGEGRDIYMYRGEKAFCSEECRCQEMLLDELMNNS